MKVCAKRSFLATLLIAVLLLGMTTPVVAQKTGPGVQKAEGVDALERLITGLRTAIERTTVLTEDDKQKLLAELDQLAQTLSTEDLQGAVEAIRSFCTKLAEHISTRAREQVRLVLQQKVKALEQEDVLDNVTAEKIRGFIEAMERRPLSPKEIANAARIIGIAHREISKSASIARGVIGTLAEETEDEEARSLLMGGFAEYRPGRGLAALLAPVEALLRNAERILRGPLPPPIAKAPPEELVKALERLKEASNSTLSALAALTSGDLQTFQESLNGAKSLLEEAKAELNKLAPAGKEGRAPAVIPGPLRSVYAMLSVATKLLERVISILQGYAEAAAGNALVMARGVLVEIDETAGIFKLFGSLHLVTMKGEPNITGLASRGTFAHEVKVVGFVPLVGLWTVKLAENASVNGSLEVGKAALVIGRLSSEEGRLVIIAETVYLGEPVRLREVERSISSL